MLMTTSSWRRIAAYLLLGVLGLGTKTFADNPPWPPSVAVVTLDPYAAEEGSDPATFLVVRIGPANAPLTVQYTLGGEAVNGEDYDTLSGQVTIPAGAYYAPVVVTPHDDFLVEGAESVVIALTQPPVVPPPYLVVWPGVAAAGIADNDREPTNQPPAVALVRPPDGALFDAGDDIPLVARADDRDGRVRTVEFFADGVSLGVVTNRPWLTPAAVWDSAEDPIFGLDSDLFPLPDLTTATGSDPGLFPGELFRFVWSNAPTGHHILTAVATDNDGDATKSATVSIEVLSTPPRTVVTIRATDPVASEPDSATDRLDTATFSIRRRGPTTDALRVFYRIGGSADNGVDYREISHSVVIPAGERRAEVLIAPLDDDLVEGAESVILSLVTPADSDDFPAAADCYDIGRSHTARAVIRDKDSPPNRPPLVRLVQPEDGDVFLSPADLRLTALARDFDGYVTTVEFFEGTNRLGIVTNHPVSSAICAPRFSLVWSNVPPGGYVLTAVATDNTGETTQSCPVEIKVVPRVYPPVVNITATDPVATEPGLVALFDSATFAITRTGDAATPLVVWYHIGGSADNGVDYQTIPNHVEIPAGKTSAEVMINPLDDLLVEGPETVVLKLVAPPFLTPTTPASTWWYRIGSNDLAGVVIRDNDIPPTNQPPRIAIVQPEDGDTFEAPANLQLVAVAKDPDGWVRTVEFFDGNLSLGVVTNRLSAGDPGGVWPDQFFRLPWANVPPGKHELTALATDIRGATATSPAIHIKVSPPAGPPVVTITATDPCASEGCWPDPWPIGVVQPFNLDPDPPLRPNTATFTVERGGSTSDELTVFYRLDGTASNGVDYEKLSGQVTIPSGQSRAQIVVVPIDDNLVEGTETVVASLEAIMCPAIYPPPPGCYTVGDPDQASALIFDNDLNYSPKAEIIHPANGDVFRPGSDIEIDVAARDPDGWVGRMEFFANHVKIGEQQINFIIAPPPGQPQRFSMIWSNVPAGEYELQAQATDDSGATSLTDPVTIKVAALPLVPVVTIKAIDPVAAEPNPLSASPVVNVATFEVSRTGKLAEALTVLYRVSGTASNGVDYVELPGEVTLPANAASALITVVPNSDGLKEGTETVILALIQPPCILGNTTTPDCYLVGQPGCDIACIRDWEQPNRPPTVALVSPANGSVFCAPVDLRLVAAASDADGWVTSVEFFDGNTSLGIVRNPVAILDSNPVHLTGLNTDVLTANSLCRPFSLIWSNVPPGLHKLSAVATDNTGDSTRSDAIEIQVRQPNTVPLVRITAPDALAREGTDNTASFLILRAGATNGPLTVFYNIYGTASNGVDYVTIPSALTIPAGQHGARLVITPLDDTLPERIETVRLGLIPPPFGPITYEIGRPARAGAVILDNDQPCRTPQLLADGLHLRLPVFPGMPFRLESSTNLVDWEVEASDYADEDGVSIVEEAGDHPQRYFRVVPEYGELGTE